MGAKSKKPKEVEVKEVAVVHAPQEVVVQQNSIDSLIEKAVTSGASVDTLERLFDLHQKVQSSQAKTAFTVAMAKLQGELPVVKKLKRGVVAPFAPLEDLVEATKVFIQGNGFRYSWDTHQTENVIQVICTATHILGHSESVEMSSEIEETVTGKESGKATKSAPQRVASTITFLKRYTFMNMFGIQVAGEDFDGRMEKQKSFVKLPPKKELPKTLEELEKRAVESIKTATIVDAVIKWDEYIKKLKTYGGQKVSDEFKKKVGELAAKKVNELENGEKN